MPTNSNQINSNQINSVPSPSDGDRVPNVDESLVKRFIDAFAPVNPSFIRFYHRRDQRASAKRLIHQHGLERILAIVHFLPKSNTTKYAPTITTPCQLEDRIGALFAWAEKEKGAKGKGKEIIGL